MPASGLGNLIMPRLDRQVVTSLGEKKLFFHQPKKISTCQNNFSTCPNYFSHQTILFFHQPGVGKGGYHPAEDGSAKDCSFTTLETLNTFLKVHCCIIFGYIFMSMCNMNSHFLSDPCAHGVRSLGSNVCPSLRTGAFWNLVQTVNVVNVVKI